MFFGLDKTSIAQNLVCLPSSSSLTIGHFAHIFALLEDKRTFLLGLFLLFSFLNWFFMEG
jgi:hypothetical protein